MKNDIDLINFNVHVIGEYFNLLFVLAAQSVYWSAPDLSNGDHKDGQ
jgi:hypothetical protein